MVCVYGSNGSSGLVWKVATRLFFVQYLPQTTSAWHICGWLFLHRQPERRHERRKVHPQSRRIQPRGLRGQGHVLEYVAWASCWTTSPARPHMTKLSCMHCNWTAIGRRVDWDMNFTTPSGGCYLLSSFKIFNCCKVQLPTCWLLAVAMILFHPDNTVGHPASPAAPDILCIYDNRWDEVYRWTCVASDSQDDKLQADYGCI